MYSYYLFCSLRSKLQLKLILSFDFGNSVEVERTDVDFESVPTTSAILVVPTIIAALATLCCSIFG